MLSLKEYRQNHFVGIRQGNSLSVLCVNRNNRKRTLRLKNFAQTLRAASLSPFKGIHFTRYHTGVEPWFISVGLNNGSTCIISFLLIGL